jgi:hypothetical protein
MNFKSSIIIIVTTSDTKFGVNGLHERQDDRERRKLRDEVLSWLSKSTTKLSKEMQSVNVRKGRVDGHCRQKDVRAG